MFLFERYHLLAAEWVDSASFWSLRKSFEEDLAFCCILKTIWRGRASMRLILEMDWEVGMPVTYFCFHPRWLVTGIPYDNGPWNLKKANVIKVSTVHWLYFVTLQAVNKNFSKQLCLRGSGICRQCMFWMLLFRVWDVPEIIQTLNTYNKSKSFFLFLCFSFFCVSHTSCIAHTVLFVFFN